MGFFEEENRRIRARHARVRTRGGTEGHVITVQRGSRVSRLLLLDNDARVWVHGHVVAVHGEA